MSVASDETRQRGLAGGGRCRFRGSGFAFAELRRREGSDARASSSAFGERARAQLPVAGAGDRLRVVSSG
jgi:hypothetical protein